MTAQTLKTEAPRLWFAQVRKQMHNVGPIYTVSWHEKSPTGRVLQNSRVFLILSSLQDFLQANFGHDWEMITG